MKNQSTSIAELNERLRSIRQRIANAKIDRRVLAAQMETSSFELAELQECEAALMRSLAGLDAAQRQAARRR